MSHFLSLYNTFLNLKCEFLQLKAPEKTSSSILEGLNDKYSRLSKDTGESLFVSETISQLEEMLTEMNKLLLLKKCDVSM